VVVHGCAAAVQDLRRHARFLRSLVATFEAEPGAKAVSLLEELLQWAEAAGDGGAQLQAPLVADSVAQLLDSLAVLAVQQVSCPSACQPCMLDGVGMT
jgi:hypothetical protein